MDAQNSARRIVAAFIILAAACTHSVFAGPVHIYAADFNLPIPAEPHSSRGWMTDAVIDIPDHFIIYDLDVGITLTHTNVFDLQIFLQSPTGSRICLNMYDPFDEFFIGENYINTIFDDEAPAYIKQGKPPFTGRFRPLESYRLSKFDGRDAFGPWHLQIYDAFYSDTGTLNSFELVITTPEPTTVILLLLGTALITFLNPRRRR